MRVYKETMDTKKNPLAKAKYRNDPCMCGSGKKIKKCCNSDFINVKYIDLAKAYENVLLGNFPKDAYTHMVAKFNTDIKAENDRFEEERQKKNEEILNKGKS